jgi:hypothetical protein
MIARTCAVVAGVFCAVGPASAEQVRGAPARIQIVVQEPLAGSVTIGAVEIRFGASYDCSPMSAVVLDGLIEAQAARRAVGVHYSPHPRFKNFWCAGTIEFYAP